jgi:hypothetical protein
VEYNDLDLNKAVFDKYLHIDIDHLLNTQDKYIHNSEEFDFLFVDMLINNDKVNWHMNLMYLKQKTNQWINTLSKYIYLLELHDCPVKPFEQIQ